MANDNRQQNPPPRTQQAAVRVDVPASARVEPPSPSASGVAESATINPLTTAQRVEPPPRVAPRIFVHGSAIDPVDDPEAAEELARAEVTIRPRKTVPICVIGHTDGNPNFYSFTAGQKCLVPNRIIPHLEEKGII